LSATNAPLTIYYSNNTLPTSGLYAALVITNGDTSSTRADDIVFDAADHGGNQRHGGAIVMGKEGHCANGSNNYPGYLAFYTRVTSDGNDTEKMRIAGTGNVGIGTTGPFTSSGCNGELCVSGGSLNLDDTYAIAWGGGTGRTSITGSKSAGTMVFGLPTASASTNAFSFTKGDVGIGTTSPVGLLETYDATAQTASYTGVLHEVLDTSSSASVNKVGMDVESTGTWNGTGAVNTGLVVNATGGTTNYAATFSGGYVGIGTATPVEALDVRGNQSTMLRTPLKCKLQTAPILDT